ncbi:uncharacterized protein LOC129614415 [Condylostylus longicornis]|uniref:uncharacterized protein LOC129614415 n=1 Tax=Condylostylus longicornis TaxID=2530218 RepID=UPI00244DE04A|nr:uncharacterized protein LOC129614415 [Condylostylus longicornis]
MSEEEHKLKLNEVWRVIHKIQNGISRFDLNIWKMFKESDLKNTGQIPETKFRNILEMLKTKLEISDNEIRKVADYFKNRNGQILYEQFYGVLNEDVQNLSPNKININSLELGDSYHINELSSNEKSHLLKILVKIAKTVKFRNIALMPSFQDYELVTRNLGNVTVPHFSRIMHFMKIFLSEEDLLLLLKGFMKDSYSVNYIAFNKAIEEIIKYFDSNERIDISQPRPLHPVFSKKNELRELNEILLQIQKHLNTNQIRLSEFFQGYDILRTGKVTSNQFVRALDSLGISGLHRLFLQQEEIDMIVQAFTDLAQSDMVNWKSFEYGINNVSSKNHLLDVKKPFHIVTKEKQDNLESGYQDKNKDLSEEANYKIKKKIENRRIDLYTFFKDFDKLNKGYVSRSRVRQILYSNGILLSEQELFALEEQFNNDVGFNYISLLKHLDPMKNEYSKFKTILSTDFKPSMHLISNLKPIEVKPADIINLISKVKSQTVIKQIRILNCFKDYDPHNMNSISEANFRRGLKIGQINLNAEELDILCKLFASPMRSNFISYRRFCDTIEEVFKQNQLEKSPLIIPLQYYPIIESIACNLNLNERNIVSSALQKLSKNANIVSNLSEIYKGFDKINHGVITKSQFLRGLCIRDLQTCISNREFDIIFKCFGTEKGKVQCKQ